jgi:hypothetical protein
MAQTNPERPRLTAVITFGKTFPFAMSCLLWQRDRCFAFQAISLTSWPAVFCLDLSAAWMQGRWRYTHAASMRMRRRCVLPVLVIRPRRFFYPLECSLETAPPSPMSGLGILNRETLPSSATTVTAEISAMCAATEGSTSLKFKQDRENGIAIRPNTAIIVYKYIHNASSILFLASMF